MSTKVLDVAVSQGVFSLIMIDEAIYVHVSTRSSGYLVFSREADEDDVTRVNSELVKWIETENRNRRSSDQRP